MLQKKNISFCGLIGDELKQEKNKKYSYYVTSILGASILRMCTFPVDREIWEIKEDLSATGEVKWSAYSPSIASSLGVMNIKLFEFYSDDFY